jgi:hypothetical protein
MCRDIFISHVVDRLDQVIVHGGNCFQSVKIIHHEMLQTIPIFPLLVPFGFLQCACNCCSKHADPCLWAAHYIDAFAHETYAELFGWQGQSRWSVWRSWLHEARSTEYADAYHVMQLARQLDVCITVASWNVTSTYDPNNAATRGRRIYLGNDDSHYVWLVPTPVPPGGAAGAVAAAAAAPATAASKATSRADRKRGAPTPSSAGGKQAGKAAKLEHPFPWRPGGIGASPQQDCPITLTCA